MTKSRAAGDFLERGLAWHDCTCYRHCVGALKILIEQGLRAQGAALMGVLNVTPDSFFDGGRYVESNEGRAQVDRLLEEGADIIDIGGESSRPAATAVSASEQIERIDAALRYALARGSVVSVDTTHPQVAEHALGLGAQLINDVSCLANPDLARVCAARGGTLILMHARGPMSQMAGFSDYPDAAYEDVVAEVAAEWRAARDRAIALGLERERVFFDPGLGFNKNARHSLELLRHLEHFQSEGVPIVVGASRKSFINAVDAAPPAQRLGGSLAAAWVAVSKGASVLRVHDVRETRQALRMVRALRTQSDSERGTEGAAELTSTLPLGGAAHA